jgi:hypothetical protein
MTLSQDGNALRGTLENPYLPGETCPLLGQAAEDGTITMTTAVGRTAYEFSGHRTSAGLALALTTQEVIPLDPGRRLSGQAGQLDGEYLVGVYSPGGMKENHMILHTAGTAITGEMFCLVDEAFLQQMSQMMQGDGPSGPGGPGGPGGPDGPGKPMPLPQLGDKNDVNVFSTGSGSADSFTVETVTAQGSRFRFTGSIDGDTIRLTMYVTDHSEGIIATPV